MKKVLILLIFLGILFFAPLAKADAVTQGDVVINEIAWMGSTNSANDEWIELHNTTDKEIHLSGWTLTSIDEKINISLIGSIPAQGFYLLERTDDNSVPNISADLIYKGSLSNAGQYLKVYDSSNNLVDQANFSTKWPAGDNMTKQTMERVDSLTWQTSNNPNGTPKARNSLGAVVNPEPHKEPALEVKPAQEPIKPFELAPVLLPAKTYPTGVIINETLPAPEGADDINEWIELYNTNAFDVDVENWKVQDVQGSIGIYTFPKNTTILPHGYMILKRPDTNITLNNDQDGVQLLSPDGAIRDTISYENAPRNQSYNKTNGDWQWSTTATPGSINILTTLVKPIKTTKKEFTVLSKVQKTDTNTINKNTTASISDAISLNGDEALHKANPWLLFLVAVGIAIASGAVLLLVKLRLFKNHVRT